MPRKKRQPPYPRWLVVWEDLQKADSVFFTSADMEAVVLLAVPGADRDSELSFDQEKKLQLHMAATAIAHGAQKDNIHTFRQHAATQLQLNQFTSNISLRKQLKKLTPGAKAYSNIVRGLADWQSAYEATYYRPKLDYTAISDMLARQANHPLVWALAQARSQRRTLYNSSYTHLSSYRR